MENLKLAVALQEDLLTSYPTLMRPILLRNSRYNQHATTGSLLVEVGAAGNSPEEAALAGRLFASAWWRCWRPEASKKTAPLHEGGFSRQAVSRMARRAVMSGRLSAGGEQIRCGPRLLAAGAVGVQTEHHGELHQEPAVGQLQENWVQRADAVPAGLTAHQGGKACLLAEHGERLAGGVNLLAHQYPDPAMEGAALRGGLYGQGAFHIVGSRREALLVESGKLRQVRDGVEHLRRKRIVDVGTVVITVRSRA